MAVATTEASTDVSEKLYEGMFLLDSNKFVANPDDVTQHLMKILETAEATVVAHRPWQDGRLAYEIEGKRKGLHYLVYFHMPGQGIPVITRRCKLSEFVLRHLVVRQPQVLFEAMVRAIEPQEEEAPAEETPAKEAPAKEAPTGEAPTGEGGVDTVTTDAAGKSAEVTGDVTDVAASDS